MQKNNITHVLTLFLKQLNIPVTKQSIEYEMEKHPNNTTMLAINDVLSYWRVPNEAYQLDLEQLLVADVPTPFIAYLSKEDAGFVVVSSIDKQQVVLSNEKWNKRILSFDEFKKLYGNGSIVIAEKEIDSGEANYRIKRRKEIIDGLRFPFVITGLALVLAIFLLTHYDLNVLKTHLVLLTFFKTIGLAISILILIQTVDFNNPLVQKLCGEKNMNCNSVLSSKASKIIEELTWSEVGFFYFAGTWLVLIFGNSHLSLIYILAILNFLSLPYTIYSIYYQWFVAKKWCILCCSIQCLLWLEFFCFAPFLFNKPFFPNLSEFSSLLTGLSIPLLGWVFIKPFLLASKQVKYLRKSFNSLKYNVGNFENALKDEVIYPLLSENDTLCLGNTNAENIITVVSDPYCQPCAKAHQTLHDWLVNREDIKLQMIFALDDNDHKTSVATHFMSLRTYLDSSTIKVAVSEWFSQKQKNYEHWAKHYPYKIDSGVADSLNKQKEWCKLADVKATPCIFINGKKLSNSYSIEDIKYLI